MGIRLSYVIGRYIYAYADKRIFFSIEAKLNNIYIVKLGSYFNHFFTNFIEVKYFNQSNEGTMKKKNLIH